jgi:hypothetical protein
VGENGVMKRRVEESAGGAAVGVGVGVTAATVMSVMTTRRLRTDRLRVEGGGGTDDGFGWDFCESSGSAAGSVWKF